MTLSTARYVQLHSHLFSAARHAEANVVAGTARQLKDILRTVPARNAGGPALPRPRRVSK